MELAIVVVVIATGAAIMLSLVYDRRVGFLAFVAGCSVALVWSALTGGKNGVNEVFGLCFSAGVVWGALEMLVIDNLRRPEKRG